MRLSNHLSPAKIHVCTLCFHDNSCKKMCRLNFSKLHLNKVDNLLPCHFPLCFHISISQTICHETRRGYKISSLLT